MYTLGELNWKSSIVSIERLGFTRGMRIGVSYLSDFYLFIGSLSLKLYFYCWMEGQCIIISHENIWNITYYIRQISNILYRRVEWKSLYCERQFIISVFDITMFYCMEGNRVKKSRYVNYVIVLVCEPGYPWMCIILMV